MHEPAGTRRPIPGVHIAACTCGWETAGRSKGSYARRDLKAHIEQAPPERGSCPHPSKRRFRTRDRAERNLTLARKDCDAGLLPSRVYLCQCGYWHLTKKAKHR